MPASCGRQQQQADQACAVEFPGRQEGRQTPSPLLNVRAPWLSRILTPNISNTYFWLFFCFWWMTHSSNSADSWRGKPRQVPLSAPHITKYLPTASHFSGGQHHLCLTQKRREAALGFLEEPSSIRKHISWLFGRRHSVWTGKNHHYITYDSPN